MIGGCSAKATCAVTLPLPINAGPQAFSAAAVSVAWSLPEGVPLVYASDATFRLIENYHPNYRSLSRNAREIAERLERDTIARADLVLYPSEWAAESAVRDYGAPGRQLMRLLLPEECCD